MHQAPGASIAEISSQLGDALTDHLKGRTLAGKNWCFNLVQRVTKPLERNEPLASFEEDVDFRQLRAINMYAQRSQECSELQLNGHIAPSSQGLVHNNTTPGK